MTIVALALLLASPSAAAKAAADAGDAIITRARAAESAQLRMLSRAPVALRTSGRFGDGKTTHTFESFRRVHYRSDGTVSNTIERGQVDGKPVKEEELRKAMGAKDAAEGARRRPQLGAGAAQLSGHGGDRGRPRDGRASTPCAVG